MKTGAFFKGTKLNDMAIVNWCQPCIDGEVRFVPACLVYEKL